MDRQELDNLKQWFSDYCRTFQTPNAEDQQNITLKEEHTRHVCDNMAAIARGLSLDEGRVMLAEAVALFHDVGRFPQYRKYHTFRDGASVNHAALGAKVLIENNVLESALKREQDLIIRAVTLHNVFAVPQGLDQEALLFLKMVRDADKLDIWRVSLEYYSQSEAERASAVGLDLPDTAGYSPELLKSLRRKEMVQMSALRTLNDFKLLQLAWLFDLNFACSIRMAVERRIIERIASLLPDTDEIRNAVDFVRDYVTGRLRGA
jgi:HD domain